MPTVIITGGTGLVGKALTQHLIKSGYSVIVFTRSKIKSDTAGVSYAQWDIDKEQIDISAIAKADYIIHLAGAGVMDKKWTEKYKLEIKNSRLKSSELLIKTLKENPHQVKGIISASAIGWYGEDTNLKHANGFIETDVPAKNFLGETCLLWEQSIEPAAQMNIRLVKLRFGIVLDNNGGAFAEFKKPVSFGIAAILGSGKQVISWIHIDDLCRMIIYGIQNENLSGVYNAVSPEPVTNKELILATAKSLRKNYFIPVHVPKIILKLILGKQSFEVLKSTTVSDKKIRTEGFTFLYPTIKLAVEELSKPEL